MKRLSDCIVTIVGLGQIGASLGRALVKRRLCRLVLGVSRRPGTIRRALRLRSAHRVTLDLHAACKQADIVMLAAPVRIILSLIPESASSMKPGSLLMDVGSTKTEIFKHATAACLKTGVQFIGGHPMAGHTGTGPSSSDPELFTGRPFILSPSPNARRSSIHLAVELARSIGAIPIRINAKQHDASVALISHLPHVIALALVLEAGIRSNQLALRLAAGSFLSATRVALSDSQMLLDIIMTNRKYILSSIRRFRASLDRLSSTIRRGDDQRMYQMILKARRIRESM
jgi:prephenate dehydrogenase